MIFCSKNTTKIYAIFLLRKVPYGSKNIWEFSQDFWSHKTRGCCGAYFSEVIFREENEYFSFMKNIPWAFVGVFQRRKGELEVDGSLG